MSAEISFNVDGTPKKLLLDRDSELHDFEAPPFLERKKPLERRIRDVHIDIHWHVIVNDQYRFLWIQKFRDGIEVRATPLAPLFEVEFEVTYMELISVLYFGERFQSILPAEVILQMMSIMGCVTGLVHDVHASRLGILTPQDFDSVKFVFETLT